MVFDSGISGLISEQMERNLKKPRHEFCPGWPQLTGWQADLQNLEGIERSWCFPEGHSPRFRKWADLDFLFISFATSFMLSISIIGSEVLIYSL